MNFSVPLCRRRPCCELKSGTWRPGAGLAGTRDSMAQIRDIPGNPGRVATLAATRTKSNLCRLPASFYEARSADAAFCWFRRLASLLALPRWQHDVIKTQKSALLFFISFSTLLRCILSSVIRRMIVSFRNSKWQWWVWKIAAYGKRLTGQVGWRRLEVSSPLMRLYIQGGPKNSTVFMH